MSQSTELINEQHPANNDPKGIGGWLILVMLGYIFSLFSLFTMISNTYNLYIDGYIKLLSNKEGGYYNPQFVLLVNFEMIANIMLLLFIVIIMFYFF